MLKNRDSWIESGLFECEIIAHVTQELKFFFSAPKLIKNIVGVHEEKRIGLGF